MNHHSFFFWEWYTSTNCRLVVWVGGLDYGIPYERDGYFGIPLESQTTNPNHQLTISWIQPPKFSTSPPEKESESSKEKDKTRTVNPTSFGGRTANFRGCTPTKFNADTPKIAKFWKEIHSHQTKKPIIFLGPEGVFHHSIRFPIISTRHWWAASINIKRQGSPWHQWIFGFNTHSKRCGFFFRWEAAYWDVHGT